jgi:hypothetical protein
MTPQIEQLVRLIREKLPTYKSIANASAALRADMEILMGPLSAEKLTELEEASAYVESTTQKVEILRQNSLIKSRDNWYSGPGVSDRHWPSLKGYLLNEKGWGKDAIESIDTSSTEVVSLLANPANEQFHCRGLVVGYVQSGKTANMTAVIAKAVDAGYNLIVVLGGVTNKLRAQTQRRISDDVVERHRDLWQLYTTSDEDDGDFAVPKNRQFTMPVQGRAQLVVMKKWTTHLAKFLETIRNSPTTIQRSLKTLIIDDECDQASVDTSKKDDIAAINLGIRKIFHSLPSVTYVGYTATPFANVFIDPRAGKDKNFEDLYPEDFITALPRPKGYFGTREVFGFDPDDASNDSGASAGRDMLRPIPPAEVKKICPANQNERETFHPVVTPELERAILWFLASCAIRRRRGQAGSHMTMLVHTSQYVGQHRNMAAAIRAWKAANLPRLLTGHGDAWTRFMEVWNIETARVPLEAEGDAALQPSDLTSELEEVSSALEVAIENGDSDDRLDFTKEPKTYIVVGGSVLARGLTLEGLSVSFFLRTSQQYDTLLQMGRWFGFRNGYADLPRLWATQDLISNFRALAAIEDEVRSEIAQYREHDTQPADFAVKVRAIPGLAITSAAKMQHAYRTSISFSGRHVQTIRFDHTDEDVVRTNWNASSRLFNDARAKGRSDATGRLYTSVPAAVIRRFLAEYEICAKHLDLKKDLLLDFVDKSTWDTWNVALIAPHGGDLSQQDLGGLGKVRTNVRSRLAEPSEYADIKALMSKGDILIDAQDQSMSSKDNWANLKARRPQTPLLLIYPINAMSEPRAKARAGGEPTRVALDAISDLIGVGIVFPGATDRSGNYFSVDLEIPSTEQLDEEDAA